ARLSRSNPPRGYASLDRADCRSGSRVAVQVKEIGGIVASLERDEPLHVRLVSRSNRFIVVTTQIVDIGTGWSAAASPRAIDPVHRDIGPGSDRQRRGVDEEPPSANGHDR